MGNKVDCIFYIYENVQNSIWFVYRSQQRLKGNFLHQLRKIVYALLLIIYIINFDFYLQCSNHNREMKWIFLKEHDSVLWMPSFCISRSYFCFYQWLKKKKLSISPDKWHIAWVPWKESEIIFLWTLIFVNSQVYQLFRSKMSKIILKKKVAVFEALIKPPFSDMSFHFTKSILFWKFIKLVENI